MFLITAENKGHYIPWTAFDTIEEARQFLENLAYTASQEDRHLVEVGHDIISIREDENGATYYRIHEDTAPMDHPDTRGKRFDYNLENWSGESDTAWITCDEFESALYGRGYYTGNHNNHSCTVNFWSQEITLECYECTPGEWVCSDMGIEREAQHPVLAALKVLANVA